MKIVVSYLSSKFEKKETINLINETSADGIHVDLMDGIYVGKKNFREQELLELFKNNNKPLDIHLMVDKPSSYFEYIFPLEPDCIYIHPSTEESVIGILNQIALREIKKGIVINPNENIEDFNHLFPFVDRVLLMSVTPGAGGQSFINDTVERLKKLIELKNDNSFEIFIDGGINDETVKLVQKADGVVSGSFICNSDDFETQIKKLKEL